MRDPRPSFFLSPLLFFGSLLLFVPSLHMRAWLSAVTNAAARQRHDVNSKKRRVGGWLICCCDRLTSLTWRLRSRETSSYDLGSGFVRGNNSSIYPRLCNHVLITHSLRGPLPSCLRSFLPTFVGFKFQNASHILTWQPFGGVVSIYRLSTKIK